MRHGLASRRPRNRGGSNGGGGPQQNNGMRRPQNQRAQVYDSNGPDVRIRGTAHQVVEKYQVLAKDAASSGDRVLTESYLQHAEHYQRIINSWVNEAPPERPSYAPPERFTMNQGQQGAGQSSHQPGSPGHAAREDLSLPASILGGGELVKADGSDGLGARGDDAAGTVIRTGPIRALDDSLAD